MYWVLRITLSDFSFLAFKRVGASVKINRIYKIVLSLSIVLQLSMFFMITTLGLWIDQLWNGAIGSMAERAELHKALFITGIVVCFFSHS